MRPPTNNDIPIVPYRLLTRYRLKCVSQQPTRQCQVSGQWEAIGVGRRSLGVESDGSRLIIKLTTVQSVRMVVRTDRPIPVLDVLTTSGRRHEQTAAWRAVLRVH